MDEFVIGCGKPGIGAILGCNPGTDHKAYASLRRTMSAGMSRKWLEHNGLCHVKNTDEEDTMKKDVGGRMNTWGSILLQKVEDSKSLPPPYTYPLVKRSKSTLSTQSLEICTESLGSETGSDGFSSYPEAELGDGILSEAAPFDVEEAALAARKTRPRSFPPPIQSLLSQGNGGGSLSMYSRRDSGRLVLEAVSIRSEKNFKARREEGRLVLTFASDDQTRRKDKEEIDEEGNDELVMEMDEDILEETEIGTAGFASESIREMYNRGLINVQKRATLLFRDSTWVGKYYAAFNYSEDEEEKQFLLEQSPSTPLTVTMPASLNTYAYLRRTKSSATTSISMTVKANSFKDLNDTTERDGYSAPLPQGCNSPSSTNPLWEPKCIATS